jgi:hypothetical protein
MTLHTEPDTGGDWLTVSSAAAALGVSPRSIQRRCVAGTLAARLVATGNGQRWEIDPAALDNSPRRDTNDANDSDTNDATAARDATQTTATPRAKRHKRQRRDTNDATQTTVATVATPGDSYAARLIEAQAAEIEFLKGTIEAERRESALTVAALRDAIKAMPKALPAPGDMASATPEPLSVAQPGATSTAGIIEAQRPEKRSFWRRLIGD